MRTNYLSALVVLAALAPDALSQTFVSPQQRRGMLSSLAMGFLTESDPDLRVSPPGNQQTPPGTFDPTLYPNAPDFSAASTYADFPAIEFDAISTGNDFIGQIRSNGAVNLGLPFPRWQAVTATVAPGAVGLSGGLIGPGSQGTVISHYLDGSSNFPRALEDTTHVEQSPAQLGYGTANAPTISGHDFAMGVLATNSGPGITSIPSSIVFLEGQGEFFFSVPQSYVNSLTQTQKDSFATRRGTGAPVTISAAAVYRRRWLPGNGTWSPIREWISPAELGLDAITDDVDALSYDAQYESAIYSTTIVTGRSQILAYDPLSPDGGSANGVPYLDTENNLLTIKLGLRDEEDDVKSLCTVDPGQEVPGNLADTFIGVPIVDEEPASPIGLSVQATRVAGAGTNPDIEFTMEATGSGGASDLLAIPVVVFLLMDSAGNPLPGGVGAVIFDPASESGTWTWTAPAPPAGYTIRAQALLFDLAASATTPQAVSYHVQVQT